MKKIVLFIFGAAMMFIALNTAIAANPSVTVGQKEGIGSYLADGSGKTLYWFKKDSKNTSACTGACLEKWPAFSAVPCSPFLHPSRQPISAPWTGLTGRNRAPSADIRSTITPWT